MVIYAEINTEEGEWQVLLCISGVEEHGMLDIGNRRQPGRTYPVSKGTECRTNDSKARKTKASG